MKIISDYNEFIKIWEVNHKYNYYGNKKIDATKFEELKQKSNINDFKRYIILMLNDNKYIVFDNAPPIDSTLYYDDETPTPKKTLDYFINYNMQNFDYNMEDYKKEIQNLEQNSCCSGRIELEPYFVYQYSNNKEQVRPIFYNYNERKTHDINKGYYVRELTEEEKNKYFEICDLLKQNYVNRLKKYFEKYNKNIVNYGYWANR